MFYVPVKFNFEGYEVQVFFSEWVDAFHVDIIRYQQQAVFPLVVNLSTPMSFPIH